MVNKKKERQIKQSYADAARANPRPSVHANPRPSAHLNPRPPLSGANLVQPQVHTSMVFKRITDGLPKKSVFSRLQFPKVSVFDQLDFKEVERTKNKASSSRPGNSGNGDGSHFQISKYLDPAKQHSSNQSKPSQYPAQHCSRCLHSNHTRAFCKGSIKCHNCNQWSHIARFCRAQQHLERRTSDKYVRQVYRRKSPQPTRTQQGPTGQRAAEVSPVQGNPSASRFCLDLQLGLVNSGIERNRATRPFTSKPTTKPYLIAVAALAPSCHGIQSH